MAKTENMDRQAQLNAEQSCEEHLREVSKSCQVTKPRIDFSYRAKLDNEIQSLTKKIRDLANAQAGRNRLRDITDARNRLLEN